MAEVLVDMMTELQSECYVAGFSETQNSNIFQYSVTSVKDKLLEDWVLCNFVAINNVFFLTLSCFFHASHFSSKSFLMKQI